MRTLFKIVFYCSILLPCKLPELLAASENIKVGAYVNDIQNIDLNSHSYIIDAYIWFRWSNSKIDPSETFEFMNSFDEWGHTVSKSYEKPQRLENGEYYQVIRVQGRFSKKFNLKHYPFDRQTLSLEIEDKEAEVEDSIYILDESQEIKINPTVTLPGFELESPTFKIATIEHPTNFGDTRSTTNKTQYTRAILEIPIVRPVPTYLVKLILPVLCVVFCASLMLSFKPTYVDARVGIGITALLTLVALQITLNDELPEIDYLILMDKIYLLTYLYIVVGLSIVVLGTWRLEKNAECIEEVSNLDVRWLTGMSCAYALALIILLANSIF